MKKIFVFVAILCQFGVYDTFTQVNLDSGLVAKYNFNGNANDASGNGLDGTILGGVSLDTNRFGDIASCYSFNGVMSEIQVADDDTLDITESLTLCAWVNPAKLGKDNKIIAKFPEDSYQLDIYQRTPTFQICQKLGPSYYSWKHCKSTDTIPLNQWSFICGVYDYQNQVMKIYLNGELRQTVATSGKINVGNAPLVIGNYYKGAQRFIGKIDDVYIYNRALTEDEIKTLYYDGDSVNLPVANYRFNGNANDASIYENHGTVDGATLDTNRFGEPNSCYNFDGSNDEITIDTSSSLNITESLTLCAWINPNSLGSDEKILTKVSDGNGYQLTIYNKKVSFQVKGEYATWSVCNSTQMLPIKRWAFVCGTYDFKNNIMKLYVNGQLNSTFPLAGKITQSDAPVVIGNTYGENQRFNGKIDDVKIYRRAISEGEVKQLYGNWHALFQKNEPEGLVAEYIFSSNANDESVYANHGKVIGAMLDTNRFGEEYSCYSFDGIDDEITIDTSASLDIRKSLSLCAWINPAQLDTNNKIVTKYVNDNGFQLTILDKKASFLIGEEGLNLTGCNSNDTLPLGQWTFICGVYDYDSSSMKIFINGKLNDSVVFSDSIPSNSAPVVIGNYFGGSQRFNGKIDDVMIFNRALSHAEIDTILYGNWHELNQEPDPLSGPVAKYYFNGNANDETGNGHNGTVEGATLDTDRFGEPNRCYSFDGINDYITIDDTSSLDIQKSLSLCAWVNPVKLGSENKIITKFPENAYQLTVNARKASFQTYTDYAWQNCRSDISIPENEWSFICGVYDYDSSLSKVYVNGKLESTKQVFGLIGTSSAPVVIGNFYNGYQRFNGKIDDVLIYDRAISEEEIDSLYNYGGWKAVAFESPKSMNEIKIYPNPANSHLTISGLMGKNNLQLFTTAGQMAFNIQTANNVETIDVQNMAAGIYILVITNIHNDRAVERIIVH